MAYPESLKTHLASGATSVARAWAVTRTDGTVLGFTDHDLPLNFEGIAFAPQSGMTARAISQTTGLSVDNTEAFGALSSDAISEEDILAGRFDGAEVRAWLVNWAAPEERALVFRGHMGEITRGDGAFTAELRGLSEKLGAEKGRIFHPRCSAILGDGHCRFNLDRSGYAAQLEVERISEAKVFHFAQVAGFADRWFEKGRLRVLTGKAKGLVGQIKNDRVQGQGARTIELWQGLAAGVAPGDRVRIEAGCDRREDTCRLKFNNYLNFRGFPHIPGDDWLMSYPVSSGTNDGGSLFR